MTLTDKAEQAVTHRPDSYVPARTLTLLGRAPGDRDRPVVWHAMHGGTGALLGALRGVRAAVALRGPQAHLAHTAVSSLVTGQVAERLLAPDLQPRRGTTSH